MTKDLITLVFQGPIFPRTFEYIRTCKNAGFANVILSTWPDKSLSDYKGKLVINSSDEAYKLDPWGTTMCRYQVYSTLGGLREVTTPYAIKHRTDEVYNLDKLIELFEQDTSKIVCHNIFYREHHHSPYHTSDKLQMGTIENLLQMYEAASEYLSGQEHDKFNLPDCPEQIITMSYLATKGRVNEEAMDEHFDFVNFADLAPFVMRFNKMSDSDYSHTKVTEDFSGNVQSIRWK